MKIKKLVKEGLASKGHKQERSLKLKAQNIKSPKTEEVQISGIKHRTGKMSWERTGCLNSKGAKSFSFQN